jgi:hypothetical protein
MTPARKRYAVEGSGTGNEEGNVAGTSIGIDEL